MAVALRAQPRFDGGNTGLSVVVEPGDVWRCGTCGGPLEWRSTDGIPNRPPWVATIRFGGTVRCDRCRRWRTFDQMTYVKLDQP